MTCSTCGATAAPGQKFCGGCGTALQRGCPACGAPSATGQRFCGECGAALASTDTTASAEIGSPPAAGAVTPVAERRLVSIVFADLVGFTPFAEERDAEDVRETLSRYFDLASQVIGRYGGTVEKFIGDAVMAVWGAPTAREDDAERAVRAALELVDAVAQLGPGIEARAGVLTGEAAVTIGATNQGMVAGDLVNTASRLQSVAPAGTVLVGEVTHRAASRAIMFEPAGEQVLKGKVAPIPAWRAIRVVAERGGRGRTDSLEAPFVGRDGDLRLLKELFHATERERRARLVSIIGTGGIGKSRLAWEFEKYLDGIVGTIWWHQGRSPAYGEGVTFWALSEMIRARTRLAETDDEATTRAAVGRTLDEHLGTDDPDRRWIEQALLELLGIRTGLPSDELFGAWRTFFERLAREGPVVLVFQDLHWADPGTLDFIDHLMEWSRSAGLFIVTLARPDLLEKRPGWGAGQRDFTSLHLDPLAESAMRQLLDGLAPGLPDRTARAIVERAEGVPLYAVETVRMLVASGQLVADEDGRLQPAGDLTELAVPETLTALIAARLDALDPADRALLLDAAVLGQSFTPAGVAAVTGADTDSLEPRLRSLVRREVLTHVADPRSPERGQYAFVQALIREVAYNTLSKRDRKSRHLAAARWFESLGEEELAGALAGHYLSARANASDGAEADALAAQARVAFRAAAERAAALGSHQQAVRFYENALTVTTDPRETADLSQRAGDSASLWSDFDAAEVHLTRSIDAYRALGDRPGAANATAMLGNTLLTGRRMDRAMAHLTAAAQEFGDLGEDPGLLLVLSQLARGHFLLGENATAFAFAERVLPPAERHDLVLILADTLVTKGSAMASLGRAREGLGIIRIGEAIAEEEGSSNIVLRARNNIMAIVTDNDPRAADEAARTGYELARRLGHRTWAHGFQAEVGYIAIRTGEMDRAMDELLAAEAEFEDSIERAPLINNIANLRIVRGEPFDAQLAELHAVVAASSDDPSTVSLLDETLAWEAFVRADLAAARDRWNDYVTRDPTNAGFGRAWTSRLSLWLGDLDRAEQDMDAYYATAPHGGAVDAIREMIIGCVAGARGDRAAAVSAAISARGRYRELGLLVDEAWLAFDLAAALGPDDPATREAATAARATFERLRAAPLLALLDRTMSADARQPVADPTISPAAR
jgi:class 3 adenylate cyclase/tetratricopeptide (TPR) repeat protein